MTKAKLRPSHNKSPIERTVRMHVNAANSLLPRRAEWDGKQWLVCPVVLLTEGVIRGALAEGNEFVPAEELIPRVWNGRAVSYYHPEESDGWSVNNLEAYARIQIGLLFNMHTGTTRTQLGVEVPALKGEMWFDLDKVERLGDEIKEDIAKLEQGVAMDVSTGYWAYAFDEPGEWKGEQYQTVTRFIQPDHLALLPSERGACSWTDGCGTPRVNVSDGGKGGGDVKINEAARQAIRNMRLLSVNMHPAPDASVNAEGLLDIYWKVDKQLEERFGWDGFWTNDVYPTGKNGTTGYVIFTRVEHKTMQSDYTIGADGVITLSEPYEVSKQTQTTYQPVVNANLEQPTEVKPSSPAPAPQQNASECGCGKGVQNMKKDLIAKVITSSNGAFTDADSPILEKMSEAALQALAASYNSESTKPEVIPSNTAPMVAGAANGASNTAPVVVNNAAVDVEAVAQRVIELNERNALIAAVNRASKVPLEVLQNTPTESLRAMLPAQPSTPTTGINYALLGGGAPPAPNTQGQEAQPRVLMSKAQRDAAQKQN